MPFLDRFNGLSADDDSPVRRSGGSAAGSVPSLYLPCTFPVPSLRRSGGSAAGSELAPLTATRAVLGFDTLTHDTTGCAMTGAVPYLPYLEGAL
jgi:hypothetical protein